MSMGMTAVKNALPTALLLLAAQRGVAMSQGSDVPLDVQVEGALVRVSRRGGQHSAWAERRRPVFSCWRTHGGRYVGLEGRLSLDGLAACRGSVLPRLRLGDDDVKLFPELPIARNCRCEGSSSFSKFFLIVKLQLPPPVVAIFAASRWPMSARLCAVDVKWRLLKLFTV